MDRSGWAVRVNDDRYAHDEEKPPPRLVKRAARRAVTKARAEAETPEFGRLLLYQASGAAGDALVALALAGSLFFSVPEATARDRVLLYLVLTVAPFAVVAPFLSRVLDRFRGSLRAAMVIAAVGRGAVAWLLSTRLESLFLFPLAFGILILSRAALVVRGAVLPTIVPTGRTLVDANASLSKAGAVAGIVAAPIGLAMIRYPGTATEMLFAASIYFAGALPALLLPSERGRRADHERFDARIVARRPAVRQAVVASAGMRFLVGFLTFHLAFALRREDLGTIGLGALVGSAAVGALLGAITAPRIRRRLKEEGILVGALAGAGVVAVVAGNWFSLATATGLVLIFGVASGAAKVSFDSIVQRDLPAAARGWAFARFEATLQLAWVIGAIPPVLIALPGGPGVVAAGVLGNVVAIVFVLGRRRTHEARHG